MVTLLEELKDNYNTFIHDLKGCVPLFIVETSDPNEVLSSIRQALNNQRRYLRAVYHDCHEQMSDTSKSVLYRMVAGIEEINNPNFSFDRKSTRSHLSKMEREYNLLLDSFSE